MGKRIDLTNKRFGKFVVKKYYGKGPQHNAAWSCVCDCGVEKVEDSMSPLHKGDIVQL